MTEHVEKLYHRETDKNSEWRSLVTPNREECQDNLSVPMKGQAGIQTICPFLKQGTVSIMGFWISRSLFFCLLPLGGRGGMCFCLAAHDLPLHGGYHTVPFLSVFWRSRSQVQWSSLICHCMSNCEPLVIVCSKQLSGILSVPFWSKGTRCRSTLT